MRLRKMRMFTHGVHEARKAWVNALKSGEFRQCHSLLKIAHPDGACSYCAEGVAVELFIDSESPEDDWEEIEDDWEEIKEDNPLASKAYSFRGDAARMDEEVADWLGLSNAGFFRDQDGGFASLIYLNDGEKLSLKKIGQIIESNPEGLFLDDEELSEFRATWPDPLPPGEEGKKQRPPRRIVG